MNPAYVLSKHCGYFQAWTVIRPLLFWKGDTSDIPDMKEYDVAKSVAQGKGECQQQGFKSCGTRKHVLEARQYTRFGASMKKVHITSVRTCGKLYKHPLSKIHGSTRMPGFPVQRELITSTILASREHTRLLEY